MLQAASSDLFNPLVPKAHNSECQNLLLLYKLSQQSLFQVKLADFYLLHSRH